ncbi:MAG: PAS domain S-box protein, partial [Cytophagales bacterium]|nr:PAS domain S-box protein [Cytophagales bacterium]
MGKQLAKHIQSQGQMPLQNTARFRHRSGSSLWIYTKAKVIAWTSDGQPTRMVGCHVDISHLKAAEHQVRRSEEKFKALASSIPDVFFAVDKHMSLTYWNQACQEHSGRTAVEVLGHPFGDL